MELKCPEQDRTGDYGTDAVGYYVEGLVDFCCVKREDTSRCVTIKFENQGVVNGFFNMPANVLMRTVRIVSRSETRRFPVLHNFLEPSLRMMEMSLYGRSMLINTIPVKTTPTLSMVCQICHLGTRPQLQALQATLRTPIRHVRSK